MRRILIPVDFSGCSDNAVRYAVEFCRQVGADKIVLLKSFYVSVYSTVLPSVDLLQVSSEEIEAERQKYELQLGELEAAVRQQVGTSVNISTALTDLPLVRGIHDTIEDQQVDLVIVGTENDECRSQESYIGEQVIGIARSSPVPVLIVPGNKVFRKIERIVLACDFKALPRLKSLRNLDSALGRFSGELLVLNVDPDQKHLAERAENEQQLADLLREYNYRLYYSSNKDVLEGISAFAAEQDAQLVIALPGRHSFFYSLTHSSITEAMTENASTPVLILK